MDSAKKFGFDVVWVLFSLLTTLISTFLLRIILARWLGPSDFGLFSLIYVIQSIAILISNFGIQHAIIKHSAEFIDNQSEISIIYTSGLIISLVFSVFSGALLVLLSNFIADVFNVIELGYLCKILALLLPFSTLLENTLGLFNGLRKMKTYAILIALRSFLMLLFSLVLVKLGFGVQGAIFGIILSVFISVILSLKFAKRYIKFKVKKFIQSSKKLVLFGIPIFGSNVANELASRADLLLIGYFLSESQVGYYAVAVSVSMLFLLVPQAIQKITFPASSEFWSNSNYQALQGMINKSMKYSACILLPMGLGVGFFSREIILTVFGINYKDAVMPLCILLIARVINGSTIVPVGASFSGIGRPGISFKLVSFQCILNIILNILFIPRLGISGAAMATAISLLSTTFIALFLLSKILNVSFDIKWFSKAFAFTFISIIMFVIGVKLIDSCLVSIFIVCTFSIFIYMFLLTKKDKEIFSSLTYSILLRK